MERQNAGIEREWDSMSSIFCKKYKSETTFLENKDPIKSCLAGHSPSCKTIRNIWMDKRLIDMEKNDMEQNV